MSWSVWSWAPEPGWTLYLVSPFEPSAQQVARAVRRVQRGVHVGVYPGAWRASIRIGADERLTQTNWNRRLRSYVWGKAPDAQAAFIVGEGLDRLLGGTYRPWAEPPDGPRVAYREMLDPVA